MKLRSDTSRKGRKMAGARSLWRANGMTTEQMDKPIIGIVNVVLVDVDVVVVGALLLAPRLYMLRTPGGPCATDAMVDFAVETQPAFVIRGMIAVEPGHGAEVMVSPCPYKTCGGAGAT